MIGKCGRNSPTYGSESLLAKMVVIAQFGAPQMVHPAFASIENHLHALYPTPLWASLAESMRAKIAEIDRNTIQNGHWVNRESSEKAASERYSVRRPYSDYTWKNGLVHSWDVIEPNEKGTMILNRCTVYDDIGRIKSDYAVLSYDHCSDENERKFWLALAGKQVERFVKPYDRAYVSFNIHGNLMSWSRFLEALQAFEPAQPQATVIPDKSIAGQSVAEEPVVLSEELALRKNG